MFVYVCVYIYVFFIHSSVNGHLDCFHVLEIVNSVAVNLGMHIYFEIIIDKQEVIEIVQRSLIYS